MTLAQGDPFVVGDIFSFQQAERMKDNWRAAAAPSNAQAGSLWSDSVNDLLKHKQGAAWKEILQADTPLSDGAQIILGTNSDGSLQYEEATNDAIIFGLPVGGGKRGLIICDQSDIGGDFTTLVPAMDTCVAIIDIDTDSAFHVGFVADDIPHLDSNRALRFQYLAYADASFFEGSETGENRYAYIYGFKTGDAIRYGRMRVNASAVFEIDAEQVGGLLQGGDLVAYWTSTYIELQDDIALIFGTDADVCMGYLDTGDIWHLCDQATLGSNIRMSVNGTGLSFFGVAPVAQAAHIPDAAGDEAATINAILVVLEDLGLVASA